MPWPQAVELLLADDPPLPQFVRLLKFIDDADLDHCPPPGEHNLSDGALPTVRPESPAIQSLWSCGLHSKGVVDVAPTLVVVSPSGSVSNVSISAWHGPLGHDCGCVINE